MREKTFDYDYTVQWPRVRVPCTYCAIKCIITTLHALFIRSATIETNKDHFALITRCVREECNTNRIMIVTCD